MIGRGFRIGRLYGIDIRVDWSWLLIATLITWNLSNIFGQLHPEWSSPLRWSLSLLAALLFFASVLAHELGHSLVARAQNIPVRNITLFLFGGVANIQREPATPKGEFLMAAAGPAVSLVIGAGMLLAAAASIFSAGILDNPVRLMAALSPAATLLLWLGSVNLILAVFNLIPGFPLDGGRVLRALLWAITRNFRRSTRWAALVGQGIAWIMIAAGVAMAMGFRLPYFGTGFINGIWLAFIGWFLNNASSQSYQQAALQEVLSGATVRSMMYTSPPSIEENETIDTLVREYAMETDEQAFPVVRDGRLVGMITVEDIRGTPEERWPITRVADVMTPAAQIDTVTPEEDGARALDKFLQRDVYQLPVVREDGPYGRQLVGMLRRRDLARWLQIHTGPPNRNSGSPR